jgi:RNA recognition motif-containing protein
MKQESANDQKVEELDTNVLSEKNVKVTIEDVQLTSIDDQVHNFDTVYKNTNPFSTPTSASSMDDEIEISKLRISNFSSDTSVDTLKKHFSKFGTVIDACIPLDRKTNRSKDFGFIVMNSSEARFNHKGQIINGREVKICTLDKPSSHYRGESNTVIVSASPETISEISEVELANFFSKYAEVKQVRKIINQATKKSAHYAFVEFAKVADVFKILGRLNSIL